MLKELLDGLVGLARDGAAPKPLDVPDARTRFYLSGAGAVSSIKLEPPPRKHQVGTLADVIALANRFREDETAGGDAIPGPVVWYGPDKAVLVIDDNGHRIEQATLTLEDSQVFRTVEALAEQKPWLEQKAFIRLLRIDLAGSLPPVELLDRVRKVTFDNGQSVLGEVRRDRESLGRQITSKVAAENGAEIPEEVTLVVPVYSTPGERDRYPVRCAVEVDAMRGAFQLVPMPDEVERARNLAVESIAERLSGDLDSGIPFYHGKP